MERLLQWITAARTSWTVLVAFAIAAAALFAVGGAESTTAPTIGLPASAESQQVDALLDRFPEAEASSGFLVFDREGEALREADLASIQENAFGGLADLAPGGAVPPPQVSDDGTVAIAVVPLEPEPDVAAQAARADALRAAASDGLDGVRVLLTGPEGFEVDIAAVFEGADLSLLLATVAVVAVLLLVTYRSPFLWLVPLAVIGAADALAGIVAGRVASAAGIALDASVTGILSVLVFGAGTNYALLLIARYREELRSHDDRREAMRLALRGAGPAIIASGSTVALALATLLLAELAGNRALGLACAVGIVVAMIVALVVLPAALLLFGRGLFWPYVPRVGSVGPMTRSVWGRIGIAVSRRPGLVAAGGVLALAAMASGMLFVQTGLSQNDRFLQPPEAVIGQEVLAEAFSAGAAAPTVVVVPVAEAEDAAAALAEVEGVDAVVPGPSTDELAQLRVTLDSSAESDRSFATVERLRAALDDVGSGAGLVGGLDATALDGADAQARDQALIIPLILVLVLLVLVVLLRALVAPLLLLVAVVASFFAAVGASWWIFRSPLFGFPGIDTNVLLLSFLFLVALGVDYSIFLVTRAQEESRQHGTTQGMIRALAATGAVITSAGILLAAVFAVLGVLPLITLTQIGVIVCVGVLIDTLLVRTVIVPATAFLTREAFWWPRRPPATVPEDDAPALPTRRSVRAAASPS